MAEKKFESKVKEDFEPIIIGFLCNWCAYAGADLAGVSRIQYPPNIRVIRVMCSGRVDPALILEAFRQGADGVLVAGCHPPSDCHYLSGNFKALKRVVLLKRVLKELGVEPERLRIEWISASEGDKFARVVSEMVREIKKLGPNPLKVRGGAE
jgi:F420-non-reducing hydrogenase iron-sulfur subunit